jgi:hypothetical protein
MSSEQTSGSRGASGNETPSRGGQRRFLLLLLVLTGLFVVWWSQPSRVTAAGTQGAQNFLPIGSTQIAREEHWVVADIGKGIAETIAFASTHQTPEFARMQFQCGESHKPGQYLFEARLGGIHAVPVQAQVTLADYLWSPDNFSPLVGQLMRQWNPSITGIRSPVDLEMFVRLSTPTPDALAREDRRLSEALTRFPHDAELHEEAALLIGSFALRHAAASFYDVRRELSRMTVHLALARALSSEHGAAGKLAEAILNTLAGRQSVALEILSRLEQNAGTGAGIPSQAHVIWARALTLRNTGDYRKLDQPGQASLLERLEYVRALNSSINSTTASDFLEDFPAENLAEWSEIILSDSFTVGQGNLWARRSFERELDEIATAYRQYHDGPIDERGWSAALNVRADHVAQDSQGLVHLEVLGWGSWAEMRQRQLCQAIKTTWNWLDDYLGAQIQAKEFWKDSEERFSQLRLLPLVELEFEGDAPGHHAYLERAGTFAEANPELVPYALWPDFTPKPSERKPQTPEAPRPILKWIWFFSTLHQGMLPYGTLYDCPAREMNSLNSLAAEELDQLKLIAPYNRRVLFHQLYRTSQSRLNPDDYEAQFATIRDYDLWSMQTIANALKADPDRYEKAFLAICRISPDHYIELGNYMVDHNRPEAAVTAFEQAIKLAPDRVYLSNNLCWLAKHYYGLGRRDDAFKVAEMAADIYSSAGLRTLGTLFECDNQLQRAEEYFEKIAKRYDSWGDLALFYGRHRRDQPAFDTGFNRLMPKIFPKGQERVDVTTLSGLPTDGVVLTGTSQISTQAGMKVGDVIVAINGVRVRNSKQYYYLLDSANSPRTEVGFCSGREYRSVVIDLPEKRIGATITDRRQN